jgi:peroxiredoxin
MLVSVFAAVLAAGCGGGGTDGGADPGAQRAASGGGSTPAVPPGSAPTASGSQSPAAGTVPPALRFRATTVDGGQFDAATLAGRPVVLWFWAAWCPRCAAAADDVKALQSAYAGKVNVVGVAGLGSGAKPMREFVDRHGIGGFPNVADDDGAVYRAFGVRAQDTYVILDAAGTTVHKGALSPDELRSRVTALAG